MADENMKTLNTRIQNRFDTYSAWDNANPVLGKGEIAIVQVPTSTGLFPDNEPAYLMKVGDGSTAFKVLDWIYAKAADVHEWAKKPEAEFGAWIAGKRYAKNDDDGTYSFTLDDAITALEETVNGKDGEGGHDQRIVVLEGKLDGIDGKVTDYVTAAIEALDLGNTYATKGEAGAALAAAEGAQDTADANADAIAILNGDADEDGSVAKKIADAIAAEDLSQYATVDALGQTDGKVTALEETVNGKDGKDGHEQRLDALEETITGLSGAMHFKGAVNEDPTKASFNVTGYEAGDVVIYGDKEYVFNKRDEDIVGAFVEFGDVSAEGERIGALEDKLTGIDTTVTKYVGDQIAAAGHATSAELEAAQAALEGEIAKKADASALQTTDGKVTALEAKVVLGTDENSKEYETVQAYVEAVKSELAKGIADNAGDIAILNGTEEQDGSVAKAVKDAVDGLETVAKTGNVADLIQTDGQYIIFNCGNATGWPTEE